MLGLTYLCLCPPERDIVFFSFKTAVLLSCKALPAANGKRILGQRAAKASLAALERRLTKWR